MHKVNLKSNSIVNIIIYYENEDEIINYAKELTKQNDSIKLVIVVNKIGKKGINYINDLLTILEIEFEIFNPGRNIGYLNGLIYGYKKTSFSSEWYILSNTDICIKDECFMKKCREEVEFKNDKVWLIGPSILAPKLEKYSNPYFSVRPSKAFYQSRIWAMKFPILFNTLFNLKSKIRSVKMKKIQSGYVYAVHGSFMFLRKELLDILSINKEWELLYDEEQYIAEIVRKNNHNVYYCSGVEILHMEGTSTGKVSIRKKAKLMIKANRRMLKEFY